MVFFLYILLKPEYIMVSSYQIPVRSAQAGAQVLSDSSGPVVRITGLFVVVYFSDTSG